eukprot:Blabericola_migrator_1__920@NODE_1227_length_5049_cov_163_123645_g832_i0_p3_GENE_NODE_1227_length_5049_cov_163_123645_g832_i0NODE_1227_length_5049_cov_163_123645_g832_i0_p3_ORF_typecomplete_len261_score58_34Adaptin_binding/PF10199_9/4_7Adaptin_binding/PF10199_9/0_11_NODE_1227_length_5049_cov_163_123645_g832_i031483930
MSFRDPVLFVSLDKSADANLKALIPALFGTAKRETEWHTKYYVSSLTWQHVTSQEDCFCLPQHTLCVIGISDKAPAADRLHDLLSDSTVVAYFVADDDPELMEPLDLSLQNELVVLKRDTVCSDALCEDSECGDSECADTHAGVSLSEFWARQVETARKSTYSLNDSEPTGVARLLEIFDLTEWKSMQRVTGVSGLVKADRDVAFEVDALESFDNLMKEIQDAQIAAQARTVSDEERRTRAADLISRLLNMLDAAAASET